MKTPSFGGFLLLAACGWPTVLAANCSTSPVRLPIKNVTIPNGKFRRGVEMQVGTPPQTLAFQPTWYVSVLHYSIGSNNIAPGSPTTLMFLGQSACMRILSIRPMPARCFAADCSTLTSRNRRDRRTRVSCQLKTPLPVPRTLTSPIYCRRTVRNSLETFLSARRSTRLNGVFKPTDRSTSSECRQIHCFSTRCTRPAQSHHDHLVISGVWMELHPGIGWMVHS